MEEDVKSHHELSEVNFGLILEGRMPPDIYNPEWFDAPYPKAVELLKKGKVREDIAKVLSPSMINNAHNAVAKWNGIGEIDAFDWPKALKDAYEARKDSDYYYKLANQLRENLPVDWTQVFSRTSARVTNDSVGLTLLKDIDYKKFDPWMDSGWDVIDNIVGGIPKHGLIVVVAETETGKSFFLGQLVNKFLHKHKKKTAAIFTLEMPGEEYAQRTIQMYPDFAELGERVYISGMAKTIDDIIAECMMMKVDFVGIDFVDWLVKEASEPAYSYVYKRCVEMARLLKIPVCLLAQPNREGLKMNRFLTKFDIRWTGMAENSAWMLIGLQKANSLDMDDDKYPLFEDNHEYLIFLKLRGQWRKQQGPGAILLEPSRQMWGGKAYQNKLWRPNSSKNVIGKNGNRKYKNHQ